MGHPIYFLEFFEQTQGISVMFQEGKERLCRVWLGPVPFVILYGAEECEAVLGSNKMLTKLFVYNFLSPWIGQGLLIRQVVKYANFKNSSIFYVHHLKFMTRGHLRPETSVSDICIRTVASGHLRPETSVSDISVPDICVRTVCARTQMHGTQMSGTDVSGRKQSDANVRTQMSGTDISGRNSRTQMTPRHF